MTSTLYTSLFLFMVITLLSVSILSYSDSIEIDDQDLTVSSHLAELDVFADLTPQFVPEPGNFIAYRSATSGYVIVNITFGYRTGSIIHGNVTNLQVNEFNETVDDSQNYFKLNTTDRMVIDSDNHFWNQSYFPFMLKTTNVTLGGNYLHYMDNVTIHNACTYQWRNNTLQVWNGTWYDAGRLVTSLFDQATGFFLTYDNGELYAEIYDTNIPALLPSIPESSTTSTISTSETSSNTDTSTSTTNGSQDASLPEESSSQTDVDSGSKTNFTPGFTMLCILSALTSLLVWLRGYNKN